MGTMKIRPIFAWYDFWVGWFWDTKKRRLYVFPIPMCGIWIDFDKKSCRFTNMALFNWFRKQSVAAPKVEVEQQPPAPLDACAYLLEQRAKRDQAQLEKRHLQRDIAAPLAARLQDFLKCYRGRINGIQFTVNLENIFAGLDQQEYLAEDKGYRIVFKVSPVSDINRYSLVLYQYYGAFLRRGVVGRYHGADLDKLMKVLVSTLVEIEDK